MGFFKGALKVIFNSHCHMSVCSVTTIPDDKASLRLNSESCHRISPSSFEKYPGL